MRQYHGDGDPQKIHHAEYALTSAERELTELRSLLAHWERNATPSRIPLPVQAGFIAVAIYMAIILVVVSYLLLVARGG